MKKIQKFLKMLSILAVVGLTILPANFAFATSAGGKELTDREKAAFIVRDEWTSWVNAFTASLSELDKNATSRIYDNMDYYDMQYRFTEKYKKVPEYLDEDGKPTQKLKDLIKKKRKEINGAKVLDYLCFTSKANGSTIKYTLTGLTSGTDVDIGYSYDGTSFAPWTPNTDITLDSGQELYVLNKKSTLSKSSTQYANFVMSGNLEASGNVDSLINFGTPGTYCYYELFSGCAALYTAPELPATTIGISAYAAMFQGCTNLVVAPNLPAAIAPRAAYLYMFENCSGLKIAPVISAKTLGSNTCEGMFRNCKALEIAPELPATTLASRCYYNMFYGCDKLKTAPTVLPAETLVLNCYGCMFEGCTILETAPSIAATTLANGCFYRMFYGCSSLNRIALTGYDGNLDSNCFDRWVNGVSNTGIIVYNGTYTDSDFGASKLPKDASNHWTVINDALDYLTFTANSDSTIKYIKTGSPNTEIYYSKNGGEWTSWSASTDVAFSRGETFRVWNNKTSLGNSNTSYVSFAMSGSIAASGNVNSMQNFNDSHSAYTFKNLFNGCAALTSAPDIPGTATGQYCYNSMFVGCSNIKSVVLPSESVNTSSYQNMFNGCSNLSEITIAYTGSFIFDKFNNWVSGVAPTGSFYYDGTDTTHGVSAIPNGWTVKSPLTFKSTADGSKIKYVLNGDLTRSNILYRRNDGSWTGWAANTEITLDNNDTLKVWNKDNVLSLSSSSYFNFVITGSVEADKDISSLLNYSNSVSQYCYYKLFDACMGLTKAPVLAATTLAPSCYQGMFSRCTALTAAPALPATTLAQSCYQGMFSGCTGFTSAPELPAKVLASNCYSNIFSGCSNLNYINIEYSGQITTAYFNNWVDGVANIGKIYYTGPTNTFGSSALPKDDTNKWTVLTPLTFTAKENNTLISYSVSTEATFDNIYYQKGNGAWTKWDAGTENGITLNNNETLKIMNRNNTLGYYDTASSTIVSLTFASTGKFEASGDVSSMVNFSLPSDYCFSYLFNDCDKLTKAPTLSATTLAKSCYQGMFSGCTSLITAPHLPATTLMYYCYKDMFNGCTSLNKITTDYTGEFGLAYFEQWVNGVPSEGLFKYLGTQETHGFNAIPDGWLVVPSGDSFTLTAKEANSSVSYKYLNRDLNEITNLSYEYAKLYYSVNGGDWNRWNRNTPIQLDNNDVLEIRNATDTLTYWSSGSSSVVGVTFVMSGNIEASGEITALMNYNSIYASCFKALFYNCSALTKAPELPNEIADACYYEMFMNCTSLEKAPRLRSTTLANSCYNNMFNGCTSLNEIKIDYTGTLDSSYVYNWVYGVGSEGTFYYNGPTTSKGVNSIPTHFTVQAFTP